MADIGKPALAPSELSQPQIEDRALQILRQHGINNLPIDPVSLANRDGIKVHNAKFSEESLSGMVAKRGADVTILVNQSDPPYRKRFTIAHELGHIFLHLRSDGDFIDTQVDLFRDSCLPSETATPQKCMEIEANQFAAALLMPMVMVKDYFQKDHSISFLAQAFNVSEEAMAIRLSRLGLA